MVEAIVQRWDVLHSNTCSTDLAAAEAAEAAVVAQRQLDPLYQHALDYAVHRYCR